MKGLLACYRAAWFYLKALTFCTPRRQDIVKLGCAQVSRILWFLLLIQELATSATEDIVLPRFRGLPTIDELAADIGVLVSHIPVVTADGYVLTMHRLGNSTGPPVLLQHGFLNAADIWLTRTRDPDLVYFLLKEGYDVYLGNMRGNTFCKRHVSLKPTDLRFWNFSFHETGYYDMPAMIDWILREREVDQLYYIGHSLGTTVFFVMCSTRPEYNAKIKVGLMLSPVAYLPELSEFTLTFLRFTLPYRRQIARAALEAGVVEIFPRTEGNVKALLDLCSYGRPTQDYCLDFFGSYMGEHRYNLDRKRFGSHSSYYFTGSSLKTAEHLSQVIATEGFDFMDLGKQGNLKVYNSSRPPSYPLERITAPVALFWSYNDNLASKRSVGKIRARLPNVILDRPNPDPKWTHVDVFVGMNAKEMLYDTIIDLMNELR